jgi:hypothetical protein
MTQRVVWDLETAAQRFETAGWVYDGVRVR